MNTSFTAKILVIDPNAENVFALKSDLENDGYRVYSAQTGHDALAVVNSEAVDLILLDLMTEDIEGFELCRILLNSTTTSDIPLLLISAREDRDDVIKGLDLGALDYIAKPFHYPVVAARIRSAIRIKQSQDKIKQINQQLVSAKNKAQESERTKGMFLANMSHEIRTPLNGVLGMSTLLMDTTLNLEQEKYVEIINSSGSLLMELLNNILDYSKFEAGNVSLEHIDFNLPVLIADVYRIIELNLSNKNIQLDINYDPELPKYFVGCPTRFRQVFLNLVSNAVKFTESGTINTDVKYVSNHQGNYSIRLEISDTGVGIDDAYIEQLFQPFRQGDDSTNRLYGGTGLGLVICKEIITLMGGRMGVESTLGSGSTFWFELDLEKAVQQHHADAVNADSRDDNSITIKDLLVNKRVLLVEDNKPNQIFVLALLKPSKAKVDIAENGKIALQMFDENNYDLILMDCQMPVMDGFEATKIIREKELKNNDSTHNVIIAMTANTMPEDRKHCIDSGMDDYISKPYDKNDFFRVISHWASKDSQ